MIVWILLSLLGLACAKGSYIVGGNDVTVDGKWPWQGSLRTSGGHSCGISLISTTWGVTAAHCVEDTPIIRLSFRFGSNNRLSGGMVVFAKTVIKHEFHRSGPGISPNDIAVVEFDREVVGDNISPVSLPPSGSDHSHNPDCWITGWGRTSATSSLPAILQEAHVQVYSMQECRDFWGANNINDGQVCQGDVDLGITSCSGDSGGPLVCKVGGYYELVGATSWGLSECRSYLPSVYTRIEYFRDWITEKTGI